MNQRSLQYSAQLVHSCVEWKSEAVGVALSWHFCSAVKRSFGQCWSHAAWRCFPEQSQKLLFTRGLLQPMFAVTSLPAKTSPHLVTALSMNSAPCFFFLFLPTFDLHLLFPFFVTLFLQLFHSVFHHHVSALTVSSFCLLALACTILLHHAKIHFTEVRFDDLHQYCPFWLFYCHFVPEQVRGKQISTII